MTRKSTWFLMLALAGSGYVWWQTHGSDADDLGLPEMAEVRNAEIESKPVDPSQQATLELKVAVGDRFPLLKTVTQELTQFFGNESQTSRSELQLLLSIAVEDIARTDRAHILAGSRLMSVRYQSVRYSHDIAGEHVEYDSTMPQFPLPDSVQAYHGLVNNSFRFWLGPDNQIAQLVDFNEFLERCVRHVAVERRQEMFSYLTTNSGDNEVANFIDDSIGLLPYKVNAKEQRTVRIGDQWTRERQVFRPIPMFLTTNYMLTDVSDRFAQITIVGDVTPARAFGPSRQPQSAVNVTILGGKSIGSCTIDRKTGLPMKSEIERHIVMNVNLGNGQEFSQRKRVVTIIRTFQQQDAVPRSSGQKPDVIQASGDTAQSPAKATPKQLDPGQIKSAKPLPPPIAQ